ncbi:MAG: phosphate signaling complex protein PhoU [Planctomycetes bacterium]|nr:phosphate signaling complex protein PhoU [Planctomycetota bacterium]
MQQKTTKDINGLRKSILLMGGRVEQQITRAFQSIVEQDRTIGKEVRVDEEQINDMELDIEAECLEILALDHPVASDLRFVISVMRINTSLERIADLAVGIAKRGSKITKAQESFTVPESVPEMMKATIKMIHNAIESLAHDDTILARKVREADDEVDDLRRKVLFWAQQNAAKLTATSISLITIASKIERIADMATNIAEDVIFAVEGENTRHS